MKDERKRNMRLAALLFFGLTFISFFAPDVNRWIILGLALLAFYWGWIE
jgi:hypothetical protein